MKGNFKPQPFNYDALHDAVSGGDIPKLKEILAAMPSLIYAKSNNGWTILHVAVAHGQLALFNYVSATYPNLLPMNTKYNSNFLHIAAANGQLHAFDHIVTRIPKLLHEKSCVGWNPLHIATANGQIKMFCQLARTYPAFIRERDYDGLTVLHVAVAQDNQELFGIIAGAHPSLIGKKTKDGKTALDMIDQSNFTDKNKFKDAATTLYELTTPESHQLRASLACIVYAPEKSQFAKLFLDLRIHIIGFLVGSNCKPIICLTSLYMKLAKMHLLDRNLTQVQFRECEVEKYRTSHITAAVEFMSGIILQTHKDLATGMLPAIKLALPQIQLQEWLTSTLIARGCEFNWLVPRDFRHDIVMNIGKLLFNQTSRELPTTQLTVVGALSKCVNQWVEKLSASNSTQTQKGSAASV